MNQPHSPEDPPEPSDPNAPIGARGTFDLAVRAVGVAIAGTLVAGHVVGCTPSVQRVEPSPVTVHDQNAINRLCYAFADESVNGLAESRTEGDITLYASLPGVPYTLARIVVGYYDDPSVRVVTDANRAALQDRMRSIIDTCKAYGWTPGAKASDQPPR